MRTVGNRKERPITFHSTSASLEMGIRFNDEIHRSFGTQSNGVKKGVYHFKSHEDANEHIDQSIANKMARQALRTSNGR